MLALGGLIGCLTGPQAESAMKHSERMEIRGRLTMGESSWRKRYISQKRRAAEGQLTR